MKLSPSEMRFIARCRKAERQWPVWRWIMLIVAVGFWVASGCILMLCVTGFRVGASPLEVAFEEDVFWFMNLACVFLAMFTILRWRGDARTTLLLKLVEAHERDDSQSGRRED